MLDIQDYQHLIESIEDKDLYKLIQETRYEDSLSLQEAFIELASLYRRHTRLSRSLVNEGGKK